MEASRYFFVFCFSSKAYTCVSKQILECVNRWNSGLTDELFVFFYCLQTKPCLERRNGTSSLPTIEITQMDKGLKGLLALDTGNLLVLISPSMLKEERREWVSRRLLFSMLGKHPKAQRQIGSCMNTVLLMLAGLQGRKEA